MTTTTIVADHHGCASSSLAGICKYPLLFRELTKLTAEGSQDLEDLQQTQSTFEEVRLCRVSRVV
jgi:hypothetical protein